MRAADAIGVPRRHRAGLLLGVALLAAALLAGTVGGAPSSGEAGGGTEPRPNVLVVMSDDQTQDSIRYMSRVEARIGGKGATFADSFTNWPLCCPSRATFLTGQYARNHDVRGNIAGDDPDNPVGGYKRFRQLYETNNLAVWLRDAGYYTGEVGKYLNGYPLDDFPNEHPFGWNEWYGAGAGVQTVYDYTLIENGNPVSYGQTEADFKGDVLTGKAVDFLERRAPRRQPFFLYVAYTAPHSGGPNPNPLPPSNCTNSTKPAPRHANSFNSEPLPQPPSFDEEDVSDKPQAIQDLTRIQDGPNGISGLTRRYRCRIESLLHIDEGVGLMLDALSQAGELDDTLVVYTADNGFFHGEHRIPNSKNRIYEEAIRVPLLIRGPGIPRAVTVRELAINADLAPTILDAADAEAGLTADGRSLLPVAAHHTVQRGRELLIEKGAVNNEGEPDDPNAFTGIRNHRYVYVEYGTGERELYDLLSDPFELQSLHADPAYDEVEAALAARLAALRSCSGRSCRRLPELSLKLSHREGEENGRACARRPVRALVRGPDAGSLDHVTFRVNGEAVAGDGTAPFRRRLPFGSLREREVSTVRAIADLLDGRRVTLDRSVRACG